MYSRYVIYNLTYFLTLVFYSNVISFKILYVQKCKGPDLIIIKMNVHICKYIILHILGKKCFFFLSFLSRICTKITDRDRYINIYIYNKLVR